MHLTKYADLIAIGSKIKNRIAETVPIIQKWVDDKPERERQRIFQLNIDLLKT